MKFHVIGLALLITTVYGCGKEEEATTAPPTVDRPPASAVTPSPPKVDAKQAGTATISGKVLFDGPVPQRKDIPAEAIEASKDAFCLQHHGDDAIASEEMIVSKDGAIRNVVVYVKGVSEKWTDGASRKAVQISQRECTYVPHVVGVMTNQPVVVTSEDDTTHNVHVVARNNRLRKQNFTQVMGDEDEMAFKRPEVGTAYVKCDIHSWMRSYICVFSHPFFAVTTDDGSFELGQVAARYTDLINAQTLR